MEFGLLGSLAVWTEGRELPLDGGRQWAVLAVLLMRPNEVVPAAKLVEELWGEQPTATSTKALHGYVSRLRKALGWDLLETRSPGYVLHLAPGGLDAERFEGLLEQGSLLLAEGAAVRARRALGEALALWRGPALADFRYESFARVEAARLEDLRLAAVEERVEADLALGRHAELVSELGALIVEHPYRERLRGRLMLALYRSGRQADALRAYRDARAALNELGIEPGQPLKQLEHQILTQDAALELSRLTRLTAVPGAPALPGPLVPTPPFPFVGRDGELDILRALLERTAGGEGSLVLLGAEAGGGKTRLLREFAHEAAAEGVLVCYGISDAAVSTPYQPLREWLEFLLRVCEPDSLLECLGAEGKSLTRLVPELARLTGTAASPAGDPESDRYLLQSAAAGLLGRLSERQPLLLVADDVHWSDSETLLLLRRLARTAPATRLLVVAAYRDRGEKLDRGFTDALSDLSRLDASTRLALGGLSAEEMGVFVRASSETEASAELTSALGELTGGTPLFLCELWRDLRESGAVEEGDGGLRLSRPLDELRGPERIGELVRQRLSRLTPESGGLLELAAVAGPRFELRVLAEAAGLEPPRLASELEETIRTGFVEELSEPAATGLFTHELVRRAIYDRVIGIRRGQLHLQVGEALESVHQADPAGVLPALAHHFTQAAAVAGAERGVDYNLRAGRAALAAGALAEGATRLQTALELGIADPRERARAEGELSYPLFEMGRGAEAEALLEESIETATGLGDRGLAARLQVELGLQRWRSDPGWNAVEMQHLAEQAIETFRELGDQSGLANAERLLGLSLSSGQGRLSEGLAAHARALAHADAAGDQVARRRNIASLGAGLCIGSTPVAEGIRRCEELREAYRDDRVLEAVLTRYLSLLYAMAGRSEDALESARASSRVLDELQEGTQSLTMQRFVAAALELAGDRAGAEREWTARWLRFRDLAGNAPDQDSVLAAAELARFYCDEGRWEEAADLLAYGRDVAHRWHLTQQILEARMAAHRGEHADALARIGDVVERAEHGGQLTVRGQAQVALAEVQRAAGSAAEADAAAARALALFEQKGNVAAAERLRSALRT